ncbi:MBL fold metallo-hydrolase [Lentibacter algarum]|nr:MBL fold metallo-hydrolase [Lentibacter algarum]
MTNPFERPIAELNLAQGLTLENDWFALKQLDQSTWAIGEPAYHQMNWSYLLVSNDEALLFDTGSGYRPIAPLVRHLTDAHISAFPSHMHHDHLGNISSFERIIVADLPILRGIAKGNQITVPDDMFLGASEGQTAPGFSVSHWASLAQSLTLGERSLHILHTPGHSPDSVSIWEPANATLFAADFIYRGELYAQTPYASLPDYLATTKHLLEILPKNLRIVCAHGQTEAGTDDMPELAYSDLTDLHVTLERLLTEAPHTGETRVNDHMLLMHSSESFSA